MTPMNQRSFMRTIHLIGSGVIGWALYGNSDFALNLAQSAAFPALGFSGLWMWLGPRLARWLKTRAATRQKEGIE